MQQPEHQQSIAQDIHIRYVFGQLTPEEEARFEDFLDANPHEADIVEGIQLFCEDRGIRSREAFDMAWGAEQEEAMDRLLQAPSVPRERSNPVPPRLWAWSAGVMFLLLLGVVFWHFRESGRLVSEWQQQKQTILRKDSIITSQDSMIRMLQKRLEQQPDSVKPALPGTMGCNLLPHERKNWHDSFLAEESKILIAAGGGDQAKGRWQDQLKGSNRNEAEAFRLLKEKVETDPKSMQPIDYYVLGSMCLLYKSSPSEAVKYLEKAEDAFRPAYNKFLLAAYLENKQFDKAKAWIKDQDIPQKDWPMAAIKCLK